MYDNADLAKKLVRLKTEHRDLDAAIHALAVAPGVDQLRLGRMKRRKLQLKDYITCLESRLIPDLNA
jgi:hypothetical protein